MKKKLLFLSFLLVTVFLVSGCQKTKNQALQEGNQPEGNSDKKITISIYYPTPDQKELRQLEDDKIKRFTEKYPNVEITKSDWQYSPNEIGMKMAANEAPTLFNTYATEGKFLAEKGWAADITDLYNQYEYKDEMNPILQKQFIIDGKVYGIAQNGYVTATVVNKKILENKGVALPPLDWTWDDMFQTAKGATDAKKGIAGIAPMGKGNEAGWNWTNFLFEAGGNIQNLDSKVTAAFNSDAGLKALQFYHKLRWEANAIPQDWALGWGDAVGAFAQGRTAMVIAGPDGPVDQALNQGGMKIEDVLVYPMPAVEKGKKHTGVLGGNYLVINPNATKEQQEMAFKYATFDYFSDIGLHSMEENIKDRKTKGLSYVPPVIQYFKDDSEYGKKVTNMYSKYDNVYSYNPAMLSLLDGKPEAQFNTQDYYGAMTNVVQEIFSKEDVDLKGILDKTADNVQKQFFDGIKLQ